MVYVYNRNDLRTLLMINILIQSEASLQPDYLTNSYKLENHTDLSLSETLDQNPSFTSQLSLKDSRDYVSK